MPMSLPLLIQLSVLALEQKHERDRHNDTGRGNAHSEPKAQGVGWCLLAEICVGAGYRCDPSATGVKQCNGEVGQTWQCIVLGTH